MEIDKLIKELEECLKSGEPIPSVMIQLMIEYLKLQNLHIEALDREHKKDAMFAYLQQEKL